MIRFLLPALTAALLSAAALPALAASTTDCPTATGNAWLNENDYNYNRAHWLPPNDPGSCAQVAHPARDTSVPPADRTRSQ